MATKQKPQQSTTKINSSQKSQKFSGTATLRQRLLTFVLPTALVPLVVASVISAIIVERRTTNEAYADLEDKVVLSTAFFDSFMQDTLDLNTTIVSNPLSIDTLRSANQKSREETLSLVPIEVLENRFQANKLLTPNNRLNNYLEYIVEESNLTEIILTEANGLNVAYSQTTSDFVQRDEAWWQEALKRRAVLEDPELDRSTNTVVFAVSQEIKDPDTGRFLGVIKTTLPTNIVRNNLQAYFADSLQESQIVQIIQPESGQIMTTLDSSDDNSEIETVVGGETITNIAAILIKSVNTNRSLKEIEQFVREEYELSDFTLQENESLSQNSTLLQFEYQNRIYNISSIPNTQLATVASISNTEVQQLGKDLFQAFALITIILTIISVIVILRLARQLSLPLLELSETTQELATGNLDLQAKVKGTVETKTLADNFNSLVGQIKESLQQQKNLTEEQRQEKEHLELAIYTLIDEISDATEGDLTVRANLDSLELSTVADLFNAIIDNLQEIAIEAKDSSSQVGSSLQQNEQEIRKLAEQAIAEAEETRNTLLSVEQMARSIKTVATNASQAEQIADDTYNTVLNSSSDMDSTVNSILNLRTTVSDTAKKMERLAESSQKISQAVSLIEEIALKTNVLAINAGAEADRAGEYGQGFSVVAEQVGVLAEQSKAAVKEISSVVMGIQAETKEVRQAMESGTTQVVNTTRLVENTKQNLTKVLEKSQTINQLMESISVSTESQANTSQSVTSLMQKIAQLSAITSQSSTEVARSIGETARVAQKLESTVSQFKVAE